MLKIYTEKTYLIEKFDYQTATILLPFYNINPTTENIDADRFSELIKYGKKFITLENIENADFIVFPFEWIPINSQSKDYKRIFDQYLNLSLKFKKPLLVFFNNDSEEAVPVDFGYIFRTSFYGSKRKPNEFAIPGWSSDFLKQLQNGSIVFRDKVAKPTVGFCGLINEIRSKVLSRIENSNKINSNFIKRSKFWGGAISNSNLNIQLATQVRKEYIENIISSDYTICVRGAGNFSYRLYETLNLGRIPIFVNTDCILPYDFIINWKDYCVWVEENEIENIEEIILQFHNSLSPKRFKELQFECRKLWEEWISPLGYFSKFELHFNKEKETQIENTNSFETLRVDSENLTDNYEPKSKELIKKIIRENWICVDVGAHWGEWTFFLEQLLKEGKIYAFEAHPENYRILRSKIMDNLSSNKIILENLAVSSLSGQNISLFEGRNKSTFEFNILGKDVDGNQTKKILEIPSVSLDEYFENNVKINFVKIDVEGAAGLVLRGMKKILKFHLPILFIECHDEEEWNEVKFLLNDHYSLFDLEMNYINPNRSTRQYHCIACPNGIQLFDVYLYFFQQKRHIFLYELEEAFSLSTIANIQKLYDKLNINLNFESFQQLFNTFLYQINLAKQRKRNNFNFNKVIEYFPIWCLTNFYTQILNEPHLSVFSLPWIEFEVIDLLEKYFTKQINTRVFEYGMGRSTIFFLSRVTELISVEHDENWFRQVNESVHQLNFQNKWKAFLIRPEPKSPNLTIDPSNPDHYGTEDAHLKNFTFQKYAESIESYPNNYFDIILIDGRARPSCLKHSLNKVKNDGLIILDNTERDYYLRAFSDVKNNFEVIDFYGPNPYNTDFTQTSVIMKKKKNSKSEASTRNQNSELSCLFVNTYYQQYLENIYRREPSLIASSYEIQKSNLISQCFGDSDFYSYWLSQYGWKTDDVIANCQPLQFSWAKENGLSNSINVQSILVEQIKKSRPTVVYFQDLSIATKPFIDSIRPFAKLIVGQIASPVPNEAYLKGFDIIVSSLPHFVEKFRSLGLTSYYLPLAFDHRIMEKINSNEKKYSLTFVGGIGNVHSERRKFLEFIANKYPLNLWGYGFDNLPQDSILLGNYKGEAWGLEMFNILSQSQITLNHHIDVAQNYSNNMRLFEATGCGSLLITDYKDNLKDLFEIGTEIVAFRSLEECSSLISYYLNHPDEANEIALNGQRRTLREHSYQKRMEKLAEILERHLRYQSEKNIFTPPNYSRISYGHQLISKNEIVSDLTDAWKNESIPFKQRALVQIELDKMYKGNIPIVFKVLADALSPIVYPKIKILEIGCASGYYYEILEYLLKTEIDYTGADYSQPLINMAQSYYPKAKFIVADGANLPFEDNTFEISISSGIILHTPNFPEHINEAIRVGKKYVVFHRTPICRVHKTQYFKKFAYDVETVELRFNEQEILELISKQNCRLINKLEYYSDENSDQFDITYVFQKLYG